MTTILKATNDTTVSVLTSVGTVANQVSRSINTIASGMDMLDMFVQTAHTKQRLRTAVDLSTFTDELLEDTALEASKRQEKIITEINSSQTLKKLYEENHIKLQAVLTALNKGPEA